MTTDDIKSILFVDKILIVIFFAIGVFNYVIHVNGLLYTLLILGIFLYLMKIKNMALRHMYYSYWGISLVLCIWSFWGLSSSSVIALEYLYSIFLLLLFVQMFTVNSPIYYPRLRWWEYDFRLRGDLKVLIKSINSFNEARLVDFRRGLGSVISFNELDLGEEYNMTILDDDVEITFTVLTKKEVNIGRGIAYGIKFKKTEEFDCISYIRNYFDKNKKVKLRNRFEND